MAGPSDLPLDRWLNERIFPAEAGLTSDDVYWGAALAAAEMIRSGTVGFADHYFHMHDVARVVVESGLRANLAWCMFGARGGEIGADLPGISRLHRGVAGSGRRPDSHDAGPTFTHDVQSAVFGTHRCGG